MDLFSHVFHMFFSYLITEILLLENLYCKNFFEIINKRGDLNKHCGIGKKSKINERGWGKGGGGVCLHTRVLIFFHLQVHRFFYAFDE